MRLFSETGRRSMWITQLNSTRLKYIGLAQTNGLYTFCATTIHDINVTITLFLALNTANCASANFVVADGTTNCHYDSLRCHQWQQIRIGINWFRHFVFLHTTNIFKRFSWVRRFEYWIQLHWNMLFCVYLKRKSTFLRPCYCLDQYWFSTIKPYRTTAVNL